MLNRNRPTPIWQPRRPDDGNPIQNGGWSESPFLDHLHARPRRSRLSLKAWFWRGYALFLFLVLIGLLWLVF